MLIVIDLAHVVVNFTALGSRNVGRRIVSFGNMLFEKRVDLAEKFLSIKSGLHGQLLVLLFSFVMSTIKSIFIQTSTEFNY